MSMPLVKIKPEKVLLNLVNEKILFSITWSSRMDKYLVYFKIKAFKTNKVDQNHV